MTGSIGKYLRWQVPEVCPRCDGTSGFEVSPSADLTQRVKCKDCNRVWSIYPDLTEEGLKQAYDDFIAKLKR